MRTRGDILWADRNDLANLAERGMIKGPLKTTEITRHTLLRNALKLCYSEAEKFAKKQKYDVVFCEGMVYDPSTLRSATCEFNFYRLSVC